MSQFSQQPPSQQPPSQQPPSQQPPSQQPPSQQKAERIIDKLLAEIKSTFNLNVKAESERRGYVELNDPSILLKLGEFLKEKGLDHLKSITGIDYPDQKKLAIVYHLSSYENPDLASLILIVKTYVPYEAPEIDSVYSIWPSSWTFERETYEMLGITFRGHPDLRLMFLPEDFEGVFPLRKSFKVRQEGLFIDKQA
jgi:NADH:ubiquinone oxidoreductase 27 kD subunit